MKALALRVEKDTGTLAGSGVYKRDGGTLSLHTRGDKFGQEGRAQGQIVADVVREAIAQSVER